MPVELSNEFWTCYANAAEHIDKKYKGLHARSFRKIIVKFLYRFFGEKIKPKYTLDFSIDFNRLYYYKNLLKNMVTFWILKEDYDFIPKSIVDVGCGAAPSTLAFIKISEFNNNEYDGIRWIDKSSSHIKIAKDFINPLDFKIEIEEKSFPYDEIFSETIIASYMLCEQKEKTITSIANYIGNYKGGVIIIDYPHIIKKISLLVHEKKIISWNIKVRVPEEIFCLVGESYVQVTGCFIKWCSNK